MKGKDGKTAIAPTSNMSSLLSSRCVFLFLLLGCVSMVIFKAVRSTDYGGPVTTIRKSPLRLLQQRVLAGRNHQEIYDGGDKYTEEVDKIDISSHKLHASTPSPKHIVSYNDGGGEGGIYGNYGDDDKEDSDDGEEDSIADIWAPMDDPDDTWKRYEDEYTNWEWTRNDQALQKWRKTLEMYGTDSRVKLMITNASVAWHQTLPFYLSTTHTYTVTEYFTKLIPKVSPFSEMKSYGRCAVVGNSGVLKHSRCGEAIDSADFVFRCNIPPLEKFEKDVGHKTSVTTMNPSMLQTRDGTQSISRSPDEPFHLVLAPYEGVILLACFSHYFYLRRCLKTIRQYNEHLDQPATMTMMHPEHFIAVWEYWRDQGMTHLPSTGFYIVNAAATLCDTVDVYGFWPFSMTGFSGAHQEQVMYHYYEDGGTWRPAHDMVGEFGRLFQLHKDGALRIHLGNCTSS